MKKFLLLLSLSMPVYAGSIATDDPRFPFIANGGFKGLCDRLDWNWGVWLSGGIDGGETYACLSTRFIKLNRIDDFIPVK